MLKNLTNTGEQDYCIAEVEEGKKYEIKISSDGSINFQYVITDETHTNTYFCGTRLSKFRDLAKNMRHLIKAEKTGHLCIRSFTPTSQETGWKNIEVSVEEV
jgi:hypothetical protein